MRILFMTNTPESPDSGAAGTEYQTALALRGLGHEVDAVWVDELPRRLRHGNLHYLFELPFTYRARMLSKLQAKAYDVVHVSQPHGYLAAKAARRHPIPPVFVHRSHGFEPRVGEALARWASLQPARPPLRRAASAAMAQLLEFNNRAITRHADGHIVSAELCAQFLHDRYGVERNRIAVIPQAPPAGYQHAPISAMDSARLDRILYVGQFTLAKAPTVLAQAFERVLAERPETTLTWVCSAQHHAAAAALLGPRGRARVSFLDWVPQDRLMDIYDAHGVFLFPSFFEGFGKAFLEAMARGLVVIASDEGGARDLMVPGENGFTVPVGDAFAMARACVAIQRAPEQAVRISVMARQPGLRHTWRHVAEETAAFYGALIALK
jgi:glycosyltransferase involved in cell wall biosynthesis